MAGRSERVGTTLVQLFEMFPDEASAQEWFEEARWPNGRACGKCGSLKTQEASHAKMPYWCTDCRSYFSVKTGTVMQPSKLSLRKWAIAIYLMKTSLKGVSSVKHGRDLGITQKSSWHMMHRMREAMRSDDPLFLGLFEADETFVGGRARNMHARRRAERRGRGVEGQTPVAGIKDRYSHRVSSAPMPNVSSPTLHQFVESRTSDDAVVYTDDWDVYTGIARVHETVRPSAGEYVRGMASANGMESFWASMK